MLIYIYMLNIPQYNYICTTNGTNTFTLVN